MAPHEGEQRYLVNRKGSACAAKGSSTRRRPWGEAEVARGKPAVGVHVRVRRDGQMPVARKKNGADRQHRRRLARKLTGNPFSLVGSSIPDLISPDDWDGAFENNKAHLLEEAKIGRDQVWIRVGRRQPHPGRMTSAEWFAALVKSTVGTWLATAAQPRVRETFEELGELKALLALALGAPGPEAVGKAVAAYQALSSAALAAIPGPDHLARDREKARRGMARAADAGPARPSLDQRICVVRPTPYGGCSA